LTARERRAPLADDGVQARGKRCDETVRLSHAQGGPDPLVGQVQPEGDVGAYRVVEQERLLRYQGSDLGDSPRPEGAQVGAVVGHRPLGRVDQAHEQRGQRGLARTRRTDQGHGAAGEHVEADLVQHLVRPVGERDVLDAHLRRALRLCQLRRPVLLRAGRGEHPLEAVPADHAARQLVQHPADRADREGQQGEQVGDPHQLAAVERAALHPGGADDEHDEDPEHGQGLHQRVEQTAHPPDPNQRVPQLMRDSREALGLLRLSAEGLHDQRTVEGLVRDRADLAA